MTQSPIQTHINRIPSHKARSTIKLNLIDKDAIDKILHFALELKCRDIYLGSGDYIRGRIYNRRVVLSDRKLTHDEVQILLISLASDTEIARLYTGLPVNERYLLPDAENENIKLGFRYSITKHSLPEGAGFNCALRPIPDMPPVANDIGVSSDILKHIKNMWKGLILVIGATGEGKTSTLAAVIRNVLEQESHMRILEFARPPEYSYHKIAIHPTNQILHHSISETGRGGDLITYDIANAVSMRQAADWFAVGEMTEIESFNSAVTLSNTGHIVSSTVHANDIASMWSRVVNMYPNEEREFVLYSLINETEILIAQKLLEKNGGGLIAVREVLLMDKSTRTRLLQHSTSHGVAKETKSILEERGQSFEQQAKTLVSQEMITAETYSQFVSRL